MTFLSREILGKVQYLVHDVQFAIVVYESTVGRDLGVDAYPELDIGLDLGGPYERILRTGADA